MLAFAAQYQFEQHEILPYFAFVSAQGDGCMLISVLCAFCRCPDSLLQLQLAQLRARNNAARVFAQLPPFHILQRRQPALPASIDAAVDRLQRSNLRLASSLKS